MAMRRWVLVLAALWLGAVPVLAGSVAGRVTDSNGLPLAGISIEATYLTYGAKDLITYGQSVKAGAVSGPDGRYHIDLGALPLGEYKAYAYRMISNGGRQILLSLVPEDDSSFASTDIVTRNFSETLVESTPELPYGNGGIFLLQNAILDYTDLGDAEVVLQPVDGGPPVIRKVRASGEGLVVTGIAFGTYRASVSLAGEALNLRAFGADPDDAFAPSVIHDFTMGPSGDQFIVEARR